MAATLLLLGYTLLPLAWWLHVRKRWRASITALVAYAFLLRLGTSLDPTLHPWDERYHALVAKRMAETPLTPRLIPDARLPHDAGDWTNAHIWLHKPPLALWCMAASIKLFGTEPWAVRLPSALLSALAVGLLAMLGRGMVSMTVGFWAALLFAINGHLVELASGRTSTDHVDAILVVFALAAMFASWKMVEYRSCRWAMFAGVLTACAFLTKSWPALLVLPVALGMAWARRLPLNAKTIGLIVVLVISGFTAASPWTIYVHSQFPAELAAEQAALLAHFTEGIEEHARPWYYYLAQLPMMQGELVLMAMVWAAVMAFGQRDRVGAALLVWALIPYIVFSFAVSKMPAYTAISAPAIHIIIAMAAVHWWSNERLQGGRRVVLRIAAVGLVVLPMRSSLDRVAPWRQAEPRYSIPRTWWHAAPNTVVTDCPWPIELMFHTPVVAAYEQSLSPGQIAELVANGFEVRSFEE
jgi:4-amino-4-deoxy-L-arabinose transferase-like glycosyltransferase